MASTSKYHPSDNSSKAPLAGLDFETFGTRDLTKVGLHNYVDDPEFAPLISAFITPERNYVFDFVLQRIETYDGITQDWTFFELPHGQTVTEVFGKMLWQYQIAAHNAAFERAVIQKKFIPSYPLRQMLDSAVAAAAHGAGRRLEVAAAQLLQHGFKMSEGKDLIKLFSIPNERFNFKRVTPEDLQDPWVAAQWNVFKLYCLIDAEMSWEIARKYPISDEEWDNYYVTQKMNERGWPVDYANLLRFKHVYESNLERTIQEFYTELNLSPEEFNLNSFKQLKEFCAERGVRTISFDELHVSKMIPRLEKKRAQPGLSIEKLTGYDEVLYLLHIKQALGGSSLKKLDTMLAQINPDQRLRDQYLHIGAAQSWRTSGRGVQLQNLKRLSRNLIDLDNPDWWMDSYSNEELAENLRQLFTAGEGQLIVGDFSSVESRGLAWLAGAQWKLDAFAQGRDMYKVLASSPAMFNVPYEDVTKEQRSIGKVGELSCGYGAGPGAVASFAEKMGMNMTEAEAADLVTNWRNANPEIVKFWQTLDTAMQDAIERDLHGTRGPFAFHVPLWSKEDSALFLLIQLQDAPSSLQLLMTSARSMQVSLEYSRSPRPIQLLSRVFHGIHQKGRNLSYYKPSERKTGSLWENMYTDPKTKQRKSYSLYGGKLAGILTQSLCREVFFNTLRNVDAKLTGDEHAQLIGQFHDEIVLEYQPDPALTQAQAEQKVSLLAQRLYEEMRTPQIQNVELVGFPLDAEVHYAHRYIK